MVGWNSVEENPFFCSSNGQSISFIAPPEWQCGCTCGSSTIGLIISMLMTFVITFGVTAVLSSVITCCVKKRRNTWPPSQPSTAVTQEQPVYEEALVSVSKEDTIKMGENVAYGPVVR